MFIFLDESGDLGFDFQNKKPSQKFVITLLICDNKAAVDSFKTAINRTVNGGVFPQEFGEYVNEVKKW